MAKLGQRLEARQGQGLVMTPQLQQAIKLLQLNNMELMEFVEEELERNPLLERDERPEPGGEDERAHTAETADPHGELSFDAPSSAADEALDADREAMYADSAPDMAGSRDTGGAVDWSRAGKGGGGSDGEDYDAAAHATREKTLREHLHDQLADLALTSADRLIAAHLIDLADDDGYMRADLAETAERLGVTVSEVEAILARLQGFEPAGVMARGLQECWPCSLPSATGWTRPWRRWSITCPSWQSMIMLPFARSAVSTRRSRRHDRGAEAADAQARPCLRL